jgi:hypothetical protein
MAKSENRCANCGGKFGLVCYHHWGLRFCRKLCKHNFVVRTAKDYAHLRTCFGFLGRSELPSTPQLRIHPDQIAPAAIPTQSGGVLPRRRDE